MEIFFPGLVCITALLIDRMLGESRRHPLVGFGAVAAWMERRMNNGTRRNGFVAVVSVCAVPCLAVYVVQQLSGSGWAGFIFNVAALYLVVGWESMKEHAMRVLKPLQQNDLEGARHHLGMIVSRDTHDMEESAVVSSTIESVLENGNDALFASLFWFAVLGPVGAVAHRLVNTLDAMWGYRNERYLQFGWAAARLDDVMAWVPARLTAICYAMAGSFRESLIACRHQSGLHKSPNAGLVMASGAGALKIVVGGPAVYAGRVEDKALLGSGDPVQRDDINRARRLVERALMVWLVGYFALLIVGLSWVYR